MYNAIFESVGADFQRVTEDRAISLAELETDLKARAPHATLLVGDGAKLVYESLDVDGLILVPEAYRQQRASGVALVAAEQIAAGIPADAAALQPNYLRLSQAERERLAREQK